MAVINLNLTAKDEEKLVPYKHKYEKIAMRTTLMTTDEKIEAAHLVKELYRHAKKPEPKNVVFVESPLVARVACAMAATGHYMEIKQPEKGFKSKTRLGRDVWNAVVGAMGWDRSLRDETHYERVTNHTNKEMFGGYLPGDSKKIDAFMGLNGSGFEYVKHVYSNHWQGGNQWDQYGAYFRYYEDEVYTKEKNKIDLEPYKAWPRLIEITGPRCVAEDFVIISDFPVLLKVNDFGRPHNATGPAIEWSDGVRQYFYNDLPVPEWIIERPQDITVAKIEAETQNDIRQVMTELYGYEKYMFETGAELIHEDTVAIGGGVKVKDKQGNLIDPCIIRFLFKDKNGRFVLFTHDGSTNRKYAIPVMAGVSSCSEARASIEGGLPEDKIVAYS